MRGGRHSANQHAVIIFPPVPLSLSLWGQVQNHVPCSVSSLALFHLFKGWAWILTFCKEEQNSSTNLEINCWHFSSLTLLMCMEKKNIYIYIYILASVKGRWAGEEQPSWRTAWRCRAPPQSISSLLIAPNERVKSKVRFTKPFGVQEASEKSFILHFPLLPSDTWWGLSHQYAHTWSQHR